MFFMYSDKMTSYYCLIDVCFAIFIVYNHEIQNNFTFVFIPTESNQTGLRKCYLLLRYHSVKLNQ